MEMHKLKFKKGQKVKIRDDLTGNEMYGYLFTTDRMTAFAGRTAIILKVERDLSYPKYSFYRIDIDGATRKWTDEMLEPIKEFNCLLQEIK